MAKLILSMDGLVLKEIPLTKERLTIGRKAHNDIQIDNLAVSGEHAAVVTILNDSFLEDLNSTNGTLVNGQSVKKHFLKNGDIIEFSKYKLKYLVDAPSPHQTADFAADVPLASKRSKAEPAMGYAARSLQAATAVPNKGAAPATASTPATSSDLPTEDLPPAVIRLLNGSSAGRQLELTRPLTSVGKHGVQAAVIARRPEGYFIMLADDSQPPEVNGKVLSLRESQLQDHDVIELAGIKMEFLLRG
jgi:hypothetical protein